MATSTKAKPAPSKKKTKEMTEIMDGDVDGELDGTEAAPATKAKTPRKSSKTKAPPRAKLYWGVFNQNLKRVAVFEFDNKKDAEKHVKDLSKNGSEHFMHRIKEVIE